MRRAVLLVLLALVPAAVPAEAPAARGACVAGIDGPRCQVWTAKVRSVNDGDTIDVDLWGDRSTASRRVRFTGVQAMELTAYTTRARAGDCHAVEATERVEQLVRRSRGLVRLAAQKWRSRSQGRLLRTVAVRRGGRWQDVGAILMREGLALWWPGWAEWASNAPYSTLLQEAMTAQRGLFDPDACGIGPSAASPLKLWVNWDADGDDGANPSGEWVKVRNLDPVNAVPLGGWYLRDAGMRRYTFPPHAAIPPGGTVTLNVGSAGDELSVFAWGQRDPVFTNPSANEAARGDGAYLFDPLGNVRAAMVFPCRTACTDPLQGAVALTASPRGNGESVTLTNLAAVPVDLDGYLLKTGPDSYHFAPGSVLPPGASMRIRMIGDPGEDAPLDRFWGLAWPTLRDGGDVVRLLTYTDIAIACVAWGSRTC